ncbi:Holliday junction branch migration protein RuvA [Spiroplasma endosymbiont of Thecophora atra]|uniref:Holliday junction branch migration protein RuvA n=1 Tax=Spiroplasma endosymbiont of Thecophora atra TaxID=3066294 RepID=UPI0030CF8B1A
MKEFYENKIIFECNDHGYIIEGVNLQTLPLNIKMKIYVYFHQKPTYEQFFGFVSKPIKTFFIHLLNISNIGPKTALRLLNQLSLDSIKLAISKQDYKILQQCKGITHKIANNIINYFSNHIKVVSNLTTSQNEKSDLVFDTLLKLGFSSIVINNFLLRNINWDLEVEEIIALAIKEIKYGY